MEKKKIMRLAQLLKMSQSKLKKEVFDILNLYYDRDMIKVGKKWIIANGDIPICLVAHLDTVFPKEPMKLVYERSASLLYNKCGGLGADDRAGVFAILDLVEAGFRPHIIFTEDEEIGCIGASELIEVYKYCPFDDLKFIIQLDRRGENDSVYYRCKNDSFERMINLFGFQTAQGSFSDISVIAPTWRVAAVNLSVGYYNEHTKHEFLDISELEATIKKVKSILINEPKLLYYDYPIVQNYCLGCGKETNFLIDLCTDCYKKFFKF